MDNVSSSPLKRSLRPRNEVNYKDIFVRKTPQKLSSSVITPMNNSASEKDHGRITATTSVNTAKAMLNARQLRSTPFLSTERSSRMSKLRSEDTENRMDDHHGHLSEAESINLYTTPVKRQENRFQMSESPTSTIKKVTRASTRKQKSFLNQQDLEKINESSKPTREDVFSDRLSSMKSQKETRQVFTNEHETERDVSKEMENLADMPTPRPSKFSFLDIFTPSKRRVDSLQDTEIELELVSEIEDENDESSGKQENVTSIDDNIRSEEDLENLEVIEELELIDDTIWDRMVDTKLVQNIRPVIVFTSSIILLAFITINSSLKLTYTFMTNVVSWTFNKLFKTIAGWSVICLCLACAAYYYNFTSLETLEKSFGFNQEIRNTHIHIDYDALDDNINIDEKNAIENIQSSTSESSDSVHLEFGRRVNALLQKLEKMEIQIQSLKNQPKISAEIVDEKLVNLKNELVSMYDKGYQSISGSLQKNLDPFSKEDLEHLSKIVIEKLKDSQIEDKKYLEEVKSKIKELQPFYIYLKQVIPTLEKFEPILTDQSNLFYKNRDYILDILRSFLIKEYGLYDSTLLKLKEFATTDIEKIKKTLEDGTHQSRMLEHLDTVVHSILSNKNFDLQSLPDYALESAGAVIISGFTSTSFSIPHQHQLVRALGSVFGIRKTIGKPPVTALQPSIQLGDCWAMDGQYGSLGIQLSRSIIPEAITVDHISKDVSYDGLEGLKTAPKDIRVWAILDRQKALTYPFREILSSEHQSEWESATAESHPPMLLLHEFRYNYPDESNHSDKPVKKATTTLLSAVSQEGKSKKKTSSLPSQTFYVNQSIIQLMNRFNFSIQDVVFDFQSNWGHQEYTCIYHVRVHGSKK